MQGTEFAKDSVVKVLSTFAIEEVIEITERLLDVLAVKYATPTPIDLQDLLMLSKKTLNENLLVAIQRQNYADVKRLLEEGANNFREALGASSKLKDADIVELVIAKAGDAISLTTLSNATLYAAKANNISVVRLLLQFEMTGGNDQQIAEALANHCQVALTEEVISKAEREIDLEMVSCKAGKAGCYDIVYNLLEKGVPVTDRMLQYAVVGGNFNIVRLLYRSGANVTPQAVIFAAETNHLDCLEFLLEVGEASHVTVRTAFSHAARSGAADTFDYFLKNYTFDKNVLNNALEWASRGCNTKFVLHLLDKGSDDLEEAFSWAVRGKCRDLAELLMRMGAKDVNGALLKAAYGGHLEMVQWMLELGANNTREAALEARKNKKYAVAQFLEQHL